MIDLTTLMTDPDFTRNFIVKRRGGSFVDGRFVSSVATLIFKNPLMPSTAREVSLLPEGDRATEAITIYTTQQLYTTRADTQEGLSDLVIFNGKSYKVVSSLPWDKYGYYKNVAVYIGGV
jgi:hypothetical protein